MNRSVSIRGAEGADMTAVVDLIYRSFREKDQPLHRDPEWALKRCKADPWFRPQDTRVLFKREKPVACVQVFRRRMRVGDREILVGCIGNVACDPEFRGQGLGGRVIAHTGSWLATAGFEAGCLFGSPALYERFGWQVCRALRLSLAGSETSRAWDPAWQVLPADAGLSVLHPLHEAFNAGRTGAVPRTPDYWQRYVGLRFAEWPYRMRVLGLPEEPDAYILWPEEGGRVSEYAWRPGDAAAREAVADALGVLAVQSGEPLQLQAVTRSLKEALDQSAAKHGWACEVSRPVRCMFLAWNDSGEIDAEETARLIEGLEDRNFLFWPLDQF